MEGIWQVTDDNSTVIDVGKGRGAQETLDMGGGRQWRVSSPQTETVQKENFLAQRWPRKFGQCDKW